MFKKPIEIKNTTLIGSWEEVQSIKASTITKDVNDTEELNGIILKGYEMKFGAKNENGEIYDKNCFDAFIQKYFVDNKLNIPVDVQHRSDLMHLAGRVIYAETNNFGFYVVAYIPKTYVNYDVVKNLLREKVLQGFSKCGWATEYESRYNEDGDFDHVFIKQMEINAISIVASPANALSFERVQEIQNATKFENKNKTKKVSLFKNQKL